MAHRPRRNPRACRRPVVAACLVPALVAVALLVPSSALATNAANDPLAGGLFKAFTVKPTKIAGEVLSQETSESLEGVEVCVNELAHPENAVKCEATNSNGKFAFEVPAGTYYVEAKPNAANEFYAARFYNEAATAAEASEFVVKAEKTNELPAAIELVPAGVIAGDATLKGAGSGVNAEVCAHEAFTEQAVRHCVEAEASGSYDITNLPVGDYVVEFSNRAHGYVTKYYLDSATEEDAALVEVEGGDVSELAAASLELGGEVSGTVTSAATKAPIDGASVCAFTEAEPYTSYACVPTGAKGEYTLAGLPPGNYTISFQDQGESYATQFWNDKGFQNAEPIEVNAGSPVSGIDAELVETGSISGTVTSHRSSAPLEEIEVCAITAGDREVAACTQTEEDGTYQITELKVGKYDVEFRAVASNYALQYYKEVSNEREATAVNVEGKVETKSVDATLFELGTIAGSVDGEGKALVGAEVCAYAQFSFEERCGKTTAGGDYELEGLEEGEYKVLFTDAGSAYVRQFFDDVSSEDKATLVKVENEKQATGIDADLPEGATVEGEVVGEAKDKTTPLEGAEVCAKLRAGFVQPVCTETNAKGDYVLQGLSGGTYVIEFSDAEAGYVTRYYNKTREAASPEEGESVELALKEKRTGIDGKLLMGGTISGQVTAENTKAAIEDSDVCAYTTQDRLVECRDSEASGDYELKGLEAGKYFVQFGAPFGSKLVSQYWDAATKLSRASAVEVKLEATTGEINPELREGGTIEGVVSGPHGVVEGANVCAEAPEGSEEFFVTCQQTDSEGKYHITGLAGGEYVVSFSDREADLSSQYYEDVTAKSKATIVRVFEEATNSGVDATLVTGGTISGTVKTAKPETAVDEANVCAIPVNTEEERVCAPSASDGSYALTGLSPGSYKVEFEKYGSSLVPQYYDEKSKLGEATVITLASGQEEANVNAKLVTGGKIEGVVKDSEEKPLEGAEVCVEPQSPTSLEFECQETGENGAYTLTGLPEDTYTVSFEDAGFVTQYFEGQEERSAAKAVAVTPPAAVGGIDATLARGGTIEGVITAGKTKTPVPEALACAIRKSKTSREELTCTESNAKGEYAATDLPPGEYIIEFKGQGASAVYETQWYDGATSEALAEIVKLQSAATQTGIDANLTLGATISGTVTNAAAKALPLVSVCATALAEGEARSCATTGEEGDYQIVGLAPGKYRVEFTPEEGSIYAAQYYNDAQTAATAETLTLTAGEQDSGIDAKLAEGGMISGSVTNSKAEPVEDVTVCAESTVQGAIQPCASTGKRGNYTIDGVPAGEYRVTFEPEVGNYLTEYYNNVFAAGEATLVKVEHAGQDKENIDATLTQGGEIRGKVTSAESKAPLEGATVCAEEVSPASTSCSFTNRSGEYTIPSLVGGKYRVKFSDGSEFQPQYWDAKLKLSEATELTVKVGETITEINAALGPKSKTPVPSATIAPTIAGTAEEGQTLKLTAADWTNSPTEFHRQWLRCNAAGEQCEAVSGQTGTTYTLTSADVGHTIRASEEASNEGGPGFAETAATAVVTAKHEEHVEPPPPPPPSEAEIKHDLLAALGNHESAQRLANVKKHGGAAVAVTAPAAGTFTIYWYYLPRGAHLSSARPVLVASGHITVSKSGRAKITVKLSSKGKSLVKHAHSIKLTGEATFSSSAIKTVKVTHAFTLH